MSALVAEVASRGHDRGHELPREPLGRAFRPLGSADRPGDCRLRARRWTSCCAHRIGDGRHGVGLLLVADRLSRSASCGANSFRKSTPERSRSRPRPHRHAHRTDRGRRSPRSRSHSQERPEEDLQTIISEIGVVADWSAAYTPNAGPMDAVVKVQLDGRARALRPGIRPHVAREIRNDANFTDLEFSFDAGGMIRGAHERGQVDAAQRPHDRQETWQGPRRRRSHQARGRSRIPGVVDARIIQRLDYPEFMIDVDRAKAADLGLTQADVMRNVVAALNSSIQFNKKNFWIDPRQPQPVFRRRAVSRRRTSRSIETLLEYPDHQPHAEASRSRLRTSPRSAAHRSRPRWTTPTLQPTIDLTMGVDGRDLGHVADDVARVIDKFGKPIGTASGARTSRDRPEHKLLAGGKIDLTGEYPRMQDTFRNLCVGPDPGLAADVLPDGRRSTNRGLCR